MKKGHGTRRGLFIFDEVFWILAGLRLLCRDGLDGGKTSAATAVSEFHSAGDLSEERVVGADAYVRAGLDAGAALAGDD